MLLKMNINPGDCCDILILYYFICLYYLRNGTLILNEKREAQPMDHMEMSGEFTSSYMPPHAVSGTEIYLPEYEDDLLLSHQ